EHAASEPGGKQLPLDALGKIQIEGKLRETARACGARRLRRVSDIDHGAECLVLASIGGPGFGARLVRNGTGERGRNEHPYDAQQHDSESPDGPLATHTHNMPVRWQMEPSRACPLSALGGRGNRVVQCLLGGKCRSTQGEMVGAVGIEPTTSPV